MSKGLVNRTTFMQTLGAQFTLEDDDSVSGTWVVGAAQMGPPDHAHGGALATLLDEAMGAAAWFTGKRVLAVHLSFDYQRPVPVGALIRINGSVERQEGRKVFTTGVILLPDETIAVRGSGIFVEAPRLLENTELGFTYLPDRQE